MQLSAIMVWDVALRPPKVSECIHYLPLSREQMCVISPVILSRIPLQEFLFLKWSLAFLYYLFFDMHPFSLALIFHSFCLRFFFFLYLLYLQCNFLQNITQLSYIIYFFFCKATLPLCHHFPLFLSQVFFFFLKEVSHFFFHSSFRQIRCMSMKEGGNKLD